MNDAFLLGLSQRIPASNLQAEQMLLGALMANNLACRHVEVFLKPAHFADPVHGRLYQAILDGHRAGRLVDAVTLRAELDPTGVLDELGGSAYLSQLLTATVGIINAGDYGRAIFDAWLRRELVDIGEEVVNNAFGADAELDGKQQVETAIQRLRSLVGMRSLVLLDNPEIQHLCDFHRAVQSQMEGLRPKPHGMIQFHEERAGMFFDMLPSGWSKMASGEEMPPVPPGAP